MDASQRQPVLVLEDQVLIALYVEELLRQAGFKDVTSFPSCAAASDWLERNNPQLVIMETKLRDGSCDHLAALLMKRNIPFIVHSVEQDRAGDHEGLATKCRWFDKPRSRRFHGSSKGMYIGELMSYVVIDRGRPFLQSGPLATMTGEFYR